MRAAQVPGLSLLRDRVRQNASVRERRRRDETARATEHKRHSTTEKRGDVESATDSQRDDDSIQLISVQPRRGGSSRVGQT